MTTMVHEGNELTVLRHEVTARYLDLRDGDPSGGWAETADRLRKAAVLADALATADEAAAGFARLGSGTIPVAEGARIGQQIRVLRWALEGTRDHEEAGA